MRLNRGTLVLLVLSVIVIVAVMLFSNQASAPDLTPTADTTGTPTNGPLFAGITANTVIRIDARNNETGEKTVITKDSQSIWTVTDATYATDRLTDQATVTTNLDRLIALRFLNRFAPEEVDNFDAATFGLDRPQYLISFTSTDGNEYIVYVGNKNPDQTRYYARIDVGTASTIELTPEVVEATAEATAESTAEGTPEAEATVESTLEPTPQTIAPRVGDTSDTTIYLVGAADLDALIRLISVPPYEAPPPTPTIFATPNPFSEVQQTATAAVQQTATQQALEATPEVTAESTSEATAAP